MYSILDILEYQTKSMNEIQQTASIIHPKLLSRLGYKDLFDDVFLDNELKVRYESDVKPLIDEYFKEIKIKVQDYIIQYFNDISNIVPILGYNLDTGEEVTEMDINILKTNFIPAFELEIIWEKLFEIPTQYNPRPFWKYGSYYVSSPNETISIVARTNPICYIQDNRNIFNKSFGKTNLEELEESFKIKDTFDYEIYIPPLTTYQDKDIPNTIKVAVHRHMILKYILENPETIQDADRIMFYSSIDKNTGKVTIVDAGG